MYWVSLLAGSLLVVILSIIIGFTIFIYFGFRPQRRIESCSPSKYRCAYRNVYIPTRKGKILFGWFIPVKDARGKDISKDAPTIIVTHGWGSNAEYSLDMMQPFIGPDRSSNILLFDVRSHGKSEREAVTTLKTFSEDTDAAMNWVQREVYGEQGTQNTSTHPPISLIGHSMGGAAVLLLASWRRDIASVISISTFAHMRWLLECFLRSFHVSKAHVPYVIRIIEWVSRFRLDDVAPVNTLNRVRCPVLLMHGTEDEVLPYSQLEQIRAASNNPKAIFAAVEGANHFTVEGLEHHLLLMKDVLKYKQLDDATTSATVSIPSETLQPTLDAVPMLDKAAHG